MFRVRIVLGMVGATVFAVGLGACAGDPDGVVEFDSPQNEVLGGIGSFCGLGGSSCDLGLTCCAGYCRDLLYDELNCGACGAPGCIHSYICQMGTCIPAPGTDCPTGTYYSSQFNHCICQSTRSDQYCYDATVGGCVAESQCGSGQCAQNLENGQWYCTG